MIATGKRAALATLTLLTLSLPAAYAQDRDPAGAEVLFREGVALKKAKKYAEACPKLEDSYKLDPAGGTLFALADCLELEGRVASAWARFQEAREFARRKGNADKEAESTKRAAALEGKLPKLSVVVSVEQRELAGLEVRRDGIVVGKGTFGSALPVDPGTHAIEASAPGKKRWSAKVEVPAGAGVTTVSVPDLAAEASAPPPVASAAPVKEPATRDTPPPDTTPPAPVSQTQRYLGYGAIGLGAVSLGVAYLFNQKQNSKVDEAAPHCPDGCDEVGKSLYKDARSAYTGSLVAGVAGALFVGGGVVLVLTAPSGKPTAKRLWLTPTVGGATFGGGF